MEPIEIRNEMRKLKRAMGPRADFYAQVDAEPVSDDEPLSASGYPNGLLNGSAFRVTGSSWPMLFERAADAWDKHQEHFHGKIVREMALRIIELTLLNGSCTDAALRGDKYTAEEVARFGVDACAKANEMAASGPFVILPAAKANAA